MRKLLKEANQKKKDKKWREEEKSYTAIKRIASAQKQNAENKRIFNKKPTQTSKIIIE